MSDLTEKQRMGRDILLGTLALAYMIGAIAFGFYCNSGGVIVVAMLTPLFLIGLWFRVFG